LLGPPLACFFAEERGDSVMKTRNTFFAVAALSATGVVALSASAQARCMGHECQGPIVGTHVNTSYRYNTVHPVQNVTRYRDVYRSYPVVNVNRVVSVTRVQPVVHVNRVTRVHNHTAVLNETERSSRMESMPARMVTSAKTIQMGGNIPAPRVNTVYRYNTVQQVHNVTQYNDVHHTQYVKNIHRIVDVTRVEPVIHTNVVTRIHDRPVFSVRNEYVHQTMMLPTRTSTTSRVMHMGSMGQRI
jgi:hypothetical protein